MNDETNNPTSTLEEQIAAIQAYADRNVERLAKWAQF